MRGGVTAVLTRLSTGVVTHAGLSLPVVLGHGRAEVRSRPAGRGRHPGVVPGGGEGLEEVGHLPLFGLGGQLAVSRLDAVLFQGDWSCSL